MFVKSQDGTIVLNNDKITQYIATDKWDGRFKVIACFGEGENYHETVMGRYQTKEKCELVLSMVADCHTMNLLFGLGKDENPRELFCDYVADQQLGLFEMPQEDEV